MIRIPTHETPTVLTILAWIIGILILLAIVIGVLRLVYVVLSAPMRRRERALAFLSVVNAAVRRGQSPEQAVCELVRRGERSLGKQAKMLAMGLEGGLGLSAALRSLPGYLPPQLVEMLAAGEEAGDIGKVIPACRQVMKDTTSRTRAALNYLIVLFGGSFFTQGIVLLIAYAIILPQYERMFADMRFPMPPLWGVVREYVPWLGVSFFVFFMTLVILYAFGPAIIRVLRLNRAAEPVFFALPWRRKRMQRDFSAMLSVLLDAGMPEAQAVTRAAQSTANWVFVQRACEAVRMLERGVPLPQAMRCIDRSGEFRWRLENASRGGTGFPSAFAGWHEALDAKAFQGEQAAAHVISTVMLFIIATPVALLAIMIFQTFVSMIRSVEATLW